RFGFADVPVRTVRGQCGPIHSWPRHRRGPGEHRLAPRGRRERTTMEGESQGSGVDQHMKGTVLKRKLRKRVDMENHEVQTSPQVYARIGGVLYLIIIVIGFCSEFFVRDKLVVSGDVAATANNIMASESLWRITIAS